MLLFGAKLINTPVMSLQTGSLLARTTRPIIDPSNLKIAAYEVDGPRINARPTLLRTADIREYGSLGMIIDSQDEFIEKGDVIKIEELYELGFNPYGMVVMTRSKQKLGKIEDFIVDTNSFVIQQLSVKRSIIKSLTQTNLLIHRSQIIEINNSAIIVKDAARKVVKTQEAPSKAAYVNPFRSQPSPQPETQT